MKKQILTLLILISAMMSFGFSSAYAQYEEIPEEVMQKSVQAYKQGVRYMKTRAYDKAVDCFNEALSYNPLLSDAYYNIASIYVAKNDIDQAYNNYVKAIALNPRDYGSILQAAKISYNRKNYTLAMKYLKYIPDDYEGYFIVKQMYKDAKNQFELNQSKIERSKISTATPSKKVIIDKFNAPAGMVVDSEDNMFVACYSDNSIVKIDKDKKRTNFVKDYLLEGPIGLAIDKYDNIYVANFDADNVLKITKNGTVTVFMDKVSKPYFLYIKDDVLYISEQGNDVVLTYNLASGK